jgi:hypothetical protein
MREERIVVSKDEDLFFLGSLLFLRTAAETAGGSFG